MDLVCGARVWAFYGHGGGSRARRLLRLLLGPLVLVAALSGSAAAQGNAYLSGHYLTTDDLDESYDTGYLTWNAAKGGISWLPDAPTEDPATRATTTDERAVLVANNLRVATGGQQGRSLIPEMVFTGEPYPVARFVNVSRAVQLDFFTVSGSCAPRDLRAEIDGVLWGGGFAEQPVDSKHRPAAPSGYVLWAFRFHSEFDVIPKGAVPKITIEFNCDPPKVGTNAGHGSVIRIPFYPEAEQISRRPEFQSSRASAEPSTESGTPPALVGAAFPLLLWRPRSRGRLAMVALAMMLAFSGCAASPTNTQPSDANGGRQRLEVVDLPAASNGTGGRGNVFGVVHDDLNIAVAGAHVSLPGTDRFTKTDGHGRFLLQGLPPAEYEYTVSKADYRVFAGRFRIEADRLVRLDITLELKVAKSAGLRPHSHDEWPPEGKVRLFDENVALPSQCGGNAGSISNTFYCYAPIALASDPDKPILVKPGTLRLEVKVTWDPGEVVVEGVGVMFRANHVGVFKNQRNWSFMAPRGSGVLTTVPTNWEMTDVGHQKVTTWELRAYVPTRGTHAWARADGPLHVTIDAYKGVVPLEPAHPIFWQGGTSLALMNGEPVGGCVCSTVFRTKGLVPPGTEALEVTLNQVTPYARDWKLGYLPADRTVDDTGFQYVEPLDGGGKPLRHFRIPLKPTETDPYYAKVTNFRLLLGSPYGDGGTIAYAYDPAFALDVAQNQQAPYAKFEVTVVAKRDPSYREE